MGRGPSIGLLAACAGILCLARTWAAAAAIPSYALTDLGTLPGTDDCRPTAINGSRTVGSCGTGASPSYATVWTAGSITKLITEGPSSGATAVNSVGSITGFVTDAIPRQHPIIWLPGQVVHLPVLEVDGMPLAINRSDMVVGYATINGKRHATLWKSGTISDLGTLGGDNSEARSINDNGEVVGVSQLVPGTCGSKCSAHHATIWLPGQPPKALPGLAPPEIFATEANAINRGGVVVGEATLSDGSMHAAMWLKGAISDLGTLGGPNSQAFAINDARHVVGIAMNGKTGVGALWENGSVWDLNALVAVDSPLKDIVALQDARGIDNADSIAVVGIDKRTRKEHAYLMTLRRGK